MPEPQPSSQTELPVDEYARKVLSGEIPACKSIILACARHQRDMARQATEAFPYYFDLAAALLAIDFIGILCPSKGEWAGKPLPLGLWQKFFLGSIFGWKNCSDGLRRFRDVFAEIPKKNGKSTLLAGVCIYMLLMDGEQGAEIYCAATTREQAREVFDEAVKMRTASPALSKRIGKSRISLFVTSTNSKLMPLSSDEEKQDGINPSCAVIDETHRHPNRQLKDMIAKSMATRRQPLTLEITTAGTDRESYCRKQHDYGMSLLDQIFVDETFFVFIAILDEGASWEDELEWAKVNPNLGLGVKLDFLRRMAQQAKNDPTARNGFLRYHLNVWTSAETRAILPEVWGACAGVLRGADPIKTRSAWLEELRGAACYGGMDLASTEDLAAFVLFFPADGDRPARVLPWFFVPEYTMEKRSRVDRVPYDLWADQGFVVATPGNQIDYAFIRSEIVKARTKFNVLEIGFDPWNATQLVGQLLDDGLNMVKIQQGFQSLTGPTKELLRLVKSSELTHGNNPVLTWNIDNLQLATDPAGNIKPDKARSREKIDGGVALIEAIGRWTANTSGPSKYETEGLTLI